MVTIIEANKPKLLIKIHQWKDLLTISTLSEVGSGYKSINPLISPSSSYSPYYTLYYIF